MQPLEYIVSAGVMNLHKIVAAYLTRGRLRRQRLAFFRILLVIKYLAV